jgi:ABC-type hemin transport system ATPase subunit
MIKIESITITELRGIRDLSLTLGSEPFVISGPNGSGTSGVVDAIQFALTGEMGRLKGAGTADITLVDHGPHVEKRDDRALLRSRSTLSFLISRKRRPSPGRSRRRRPRRSRQTTQPSRQCSPSWLITARLPCREGRSSSSSSLKRQSDPEMFKRYSVR